MIELINALYAQVVTRYAHIVDILQVHLTRARASGGVFARSVARPPRDCACPARSSWPCIPSCRAAHGYGSKTPGAALERAPGDLALVPGGPDHHVAHQRGAACISPERFREQHLDDAHADHREATVFLCGAYRFS